jgi:hypothetical protein
VVDGGASTWWTGGASTWWTGGIHVVDGGHPRGGRAYADFEKMQYSLTYEEQNRASNPHKLDNIKN